MKSSVIRDTFCNFFKNKQHHIVSSAPMVIKNDPTLLFTNAGMNQFKDIFLGNVAPEYMRVANSQKCLRVSGKHNDLEEVGIDTYHHTMFEMLGNWSFGDYFKKEAIEWAWELLTKEYGINEERLYATVFKGDEVEHLAADTESLDLWKSIIPEHRIVYGNKKDNFWEMGDTGPCGPCSEIHIDLRSEEERKKIDGKDLVNTGNSEVIEIWNLVFIQYNRKADGSLELLPQKHVDTGMGFERLCRVIQQKKSNYDTDVFQPILNEISKIAGTKYGISEKQDIAMRVIADHIRAVSFAIADGQIPSNTGAGYVIRRILRRAVRYGFTFLQQDKPFIYKLLPALITSMGEAYPELIAQKDSIVKVIEEEEQSFLRTLETGIRLLDGIIEKQKKMNVPEISGNTVFELYDTYGFPVDLTELILREHRLTYTKKEFEQAMEQQKQRSRNASAMTSDDWIEIKPLATSSFIGYTSYECSVEIIKYRKVKQKGKEFYQLVFDKTPFYAESGGQIGDKGILESKEEKIPIFDTRKENDLIVHFTTKLPKNFQQLFIAKIDIDKRIKTQNNHTATHLLHAALRIELGKHVEQKGSLVTDEYLRFDFSHFGKMTDEEIEKVELMVNEKIRSNIEATIQNDIPIDDALKQGAMALFGEKYGNKVRVVTFDPHYSVELCGGTHVKATGQIGLFKIISESAIAAGIRRIEAVTGTAAEIFINNQLKLFKAIKFILKNPKEPLKAIETIINENDRLTKQLELLRHEKLITLKNELLKKVKIVNGVNTICENIEVSKVDDLKTIAFNLKNEVPNLYLALGTEIEHKAHIAVMISENLIDEKKINANVIIKEVAVEIQGGGGGQPFFATAGGTNPKGILRALEKISEIITKK